MAMFNSPTYGKVHGFTQSHITMAVLFYIYLHVSWPLSKSRIKHIIIHSVHGFVFSGRSM